MIYVDTNGNAFSHLSPPAEGTSENHTTTKTKGVFESFKNKVRQAGSSVKGLADRVIDAIVIYKRVAFITTGLALIVLGQVLIPVSFGATLALSVVGGGIVGFNAAKLYQEINGTCI